MIRWFKSDAGRWFVIGVSSSTLLWTTTRGPYDAWTLLLAIAGLAILLVLLTYALHGDRRPWLRTMNLVEKPDGQVQVHGDEAARQQWVRAGS